MKEIRLPMSEKPTCQELKNRVRELEEESIKLKLSEEHLRSLMESATDFAVFRLVSDKTNPHQLKVKFVSPSVKDILGIPEPMKFETWFKSMHPEDVERIDKANQRAFTTLRFDEEYRTYNKKKEAWRWIHAISTGGVDKNGWNNYVNGILLDVTDRKQAEEKVKEKTKALKKLNEQIIYAEGRERKSVAADLHDSVAQTLAISISKIKTIQESGEPINLEIIAEIQVHLEQTVKEIRSLIYQLSPPVLDDFDIAIALGFLIEENNEKYGVDIKYIKNINPPIHIIKPNKITLYRAVNELVINIIKHSGSKESEIELSKNEKFLLLRVEDTGIGFDLDKVTDKNFNGFGIHSFSERIKNMGGNFELFSKPGKGTKVLLSIPLSSESDIEN